MRVPMKSLALQMALLACLALEAGAQKFITLSHRDKKSARQQITIAEGNRVKCKFKDGSAVVGVVDKIMQDSIQIDGKKFLLADIRKLTNRKKGATALILGTQVIPALGGAISIAAGNLPIAVGCFAVDILGWIFFAAPRYEYPLRNIESKWHADVHDFAHSKRISP